MPRVAHHHHSLVYTETVRLEHAESGPQKMGSIMKQLPGKGGAPSILADWGDKSSAEWLSTYFTEKIDKTQETCCLNSCIPAHFIQAAPSSANQPPVPLRSCNWRESHEDNETTKTNLLNCWPTTTKMITCYVDIPLLVIVKHNTNVCLLTYFHQHDYWVCWHSLACHLEA